MQKLFSILILVCFIFTSIIGPNPVHAKDFVLPSAGQMVALSPAFSPAVLKGIKLDPKDPFRFHFFVDRGDEDLSASPRDDSALRNQSTKLIKYFLASLTTPEKDLWVNLSPYEKDRIVPQEFGQTEMGRDLLAQDYLLKQITASVIYPESQLGKEFWAKVYAQAQAKYGTTNIPINTFNKVWIVPEKAVVYENGSVAYVLENRLRVMLEADYLSMSKHTDVGAGSPSPNVLGGETRGQDPDINKLGSDIVRQIVIPTLTREVNEGKNFAQLRQVFYSLILATWYKKKIKDSILNKIYSNRNKISGVDVAGQDKDKIYQEYLKAFKKGVYNFIKEEPDPLTHLTMPRKYFSGGVDALRIGPLETYVTKQMISPAQKAAIAQASVVEIIGDVQLASSATADSASGAMSVRHLKLLLIGATGLVLSSNAADFSNGWKSSGELKVEATMSRTDTPESVARSLMTDLGLSMDKKSLVEKKIRETFPKGFINQKIDVTPIVIYIEWLKVREQYPLVHSQMITINGKQLPVCFINDKRFGLEGRSFPGLGIAINMSGFYSDWQAKIIQGIPIKGMPDDITKAYKVVLDGISLENYLINKIVAALAHEQYHQIGIDLPDTGINEFLQGRVIDPDEQKDKEIRFRFKQEASAILTELIYCPRPKIDLNSLYELRLNSKKEYQLAGEFVSKKVLRQLGYVGFFSHESILEYLGQKGITDEKVREAARAVYTNTFGVIPVIRNLDISAEFRNKLKSSKAMTSYLGNQDALSSSQAMADGAMQALIELINKGAEEGNYDYLKVVYAFSHGEPLGGGRLGALAVLSDDEIKEVNVEDLVRDFYQTLRAHADSFLLFHEEMPLLSTQVTKLQYVYNEIRDTIMPDLLEALIKDYVRGHSLGQRVALYLEQLKNRNHTTKKGDFYQRTYRLVQYCLTKDPMLLNPDYVFNDSDQGLFKYNFMMGLFFNSDIGSQDTPSGLTSEQDRFNNFVRSLEQINADDFNVITTQLTKDAYWSTVIEGLKKVLSNPAQSSFESINAAMADGANGAMSIRDTDKLLARAKTLYGDLYKIVYSFKKFDDQNIAAFWHMTFNNTVLIEYKLGALRERSGEASKNLESITSKLDALEDTLNIFSNLKRAKKWANTASTSRPFRGDRTNIQNGVDFVQEGILTQEMADYLASMNEQAKPIIKELRAIVEKLASRAMSVKDDEALLKERIYDEYKVMFQGWMEDLLKARQKGNNSIFYIGGYPGAGKTVMAELFKRFLQEHGYSTVVISIDNFYKKPEFKFEIISLALRNILWNIPLIYEKCKEFKAYFRNKHSDEQHGVNLLNQQLQTFKTAPQGTMVTLSIPSQGNIQISSDAVVILEGALTMRILPLLSPTKSVFMQIDASLAENRIFNRNRRLGHSPVLSYLHSRLLNTRVFRGIIAKLVNNTNDLISMASDGTITYSPGDANGAMAVTLYSFIEDLGIDKTLITKIKDTVLSLLPSRAPNAGGITQRDSPTDLDIYDLFRKGYLVEDPFSISGYLVNGDIDSKKANIRRDFPETYKTIIPFLMEKRREFIESRSRRITIRTMMAILRDYIVIGDTIGSLGPTNSLTKLREALIKNKLLSSDNGLFPTQEVTEQSDVFVLGLSVRPARIMNNANIYTIGQLIEKTPQQLLKYRNFAKECLAEIRAKLAKLKDERFHLKGDAAMNVMQLKGELESAKVPTWAQEIFLSAGVKKDVAETLTLLDQAHQSLNDYVFYLQRVSSGEISDYLEGLRARGKVQLQAHYDDSGPQGAIKEALMSRQFMEETLRNLNSQIKVDDVGVVVASYFNERYTGQGQGAGYKDVVLVTIFNREQDLQEDFIVYAGHSAYCLNYQKADQFMRDGVAVGKLLRFGSVYHATEEESVWSVEQVDSGVFFANRNFEGTLRFYLELFTKYGLSIHDPKMDQVVWDFEGAKLADVETLTRTDPNDPENREEFLRGLLDIGMLNRSSPSEFAPILAEYGLLTKDRAEAWGVEFLLNHKMAATEENPGANGAMKVEKFEDLFAEGNDAFVTDIKDPQLGKISVFEDKDKLIHIVYGLYGLSTFKEHFQYQHFIFNEQGQLMEMRQRRDTGNHMIVYHPDLPSGLPRLEIEKKQVQFGGVLPDMLARAKEEFDFMKGTAEYHIDTRSLKDADFIINNSARALVFLNAWNMRKDVTEGSLIRLSQQLSSQLPIGYTRFVKDVESKDSYGSYVRKVTLKAKKGFHATVARSTAKLAREYTHLGIFIHFNGQRVNAKEEIETLTLMAANGAEILVEIKAERRDSAEAEDFMTKFTKIIQPSEGDDAVEGEQAMAAYDESANTNGAMKNESKRPVKYKEIWEEWRVIHEALFGLNKVIHQVAVYHAIRSHIIPLASVGLKMELICYGMQGNISEIRKSLSELESGINELIDGIPLLPKNPKLKRSSPLEKRDDFRWGVPSAVHQDLLTYLDQNKSEVLEELNRVKTVFNQQKEKILEEVDRANGAMNATDASTRSAMANAAMYGGLDNIEKTIAAINHGGDVREDALSELARWLWQDERRFDHYLDRDDPEGQELLQALQKKNIEEVLRILEVIHKRAKAECDEDTMATFLFLELDKDTEHTRNFWREMRQMGRVMDEMLAGGEVYLGDSRKVIDWVKEKLTQTDGKPVEILGSEVRKIVGSNVSFETFQTWLNAYDGKPGFKIEGRGAIDSYEWIAEVSFDKAMGSGPGGIDLNPAQMSLKVKAQGEDFKFEFNGVQIDAAQVTGATFAIKTMTPVTNLPLILGISG